MKCRKNNKTKKIIFASVLMVLLAFIPSAKVEQADVPVFRVVIDPGHGGFFSRDKKKHGDKYDSVRGEYLEYFAEGANFKGLYEHEVVYSIALKVMERLALCSMMGIFTRSTIIF